MPRRLIRVGDERPLLDIASYARRGSGPRDDLSQQEIELIDRTVRRAPEVMVKVLTRGGQDFKAVGRHIAYLNRRGEVEIETDDSQRLSGKGVEKGLLEDWDPGPGRASAHGRHRITVEANSTKARSQGLVLDAAGTPPAKVLTAVKHFAREQFALKHRYAMVLHTDEPHPHVHMVVKAVSERGVRLNIRKATLREWRRKFARHLRAHGVEANATERAVRGNRLPAKLDGIYRAEQRGESHRTRTRVEELARRPLRGNLGVENGRARLLETRKKVERGWFAVGDILMAEGQGELAKHVWRFASSLPPPITERERIALDLRSRVREAPARDASAQTPRVQ